MWPHVAGKKILPGLYLLSTALSLWPAIVPAANCATVKPLYVPVETVRRSLGLRGQTRDQYLDSRYGDGAWRNDQEEVIRIDLAAPSEPVTIHLAPTKETKRHIDLIVEAQISYIDNDNRKTIAFGHRPIGRFPVVPGDSATLSVPRDVFRESGAIVVVVSSSDLSSAQRYTVASANVLLADCSHRIYVEDRFTAIRLNRKDGTE